MPDSFGAQRFRWIVVTIGLTAVAAFAPCVVAAAPPPPGGSDHAEVVAQGLLQLDGGEMQWSASMLDIAAGTTLSSDRPTFVAAAGGSPLLIEGSDGIDAILNAGEALFRPAAATSDGSALGVDPSHAAVLGVGSPGGEGVVGDPFVPGAGAHEVELMHDSLAPGETLTLGGVLPVLLFVADGAVVARADGAASEEGVVEVVPGDATITSHTDTSASVFVGVVGPVIDLTTPTTTTAGATITTVPAAVTTSTATAPATTTPPVTTPAVPSTTAPPPPSTTPPDGDSDGLSNSDEEAYGTNPGVFDTDGDGLGDGDEVFVYGTNPTDSDTDDNGIVDPG